MYTQQCFVVPLKSPLPVLSIRFAEAQIDLALAHASTQNADLLAPALLQIEEAVTNLLNGIRCFDLNVVVAPEQRPSREILREITPHYWRPSETICPLEDLQELTEHVQSITQSLLGCIRQGETPPKELIKQLANLTRRLSLDL